MNYYRFFMGDYQRDTTELNFIEDGAYRRMLDYAYAKKRPLPKDRDRIYRAVRAVAAEEKAAVDYILTEFWTETEEGWTNNRVMKELAKREEYSRTQSEKGKRGGRPRKDQENPDEKPGLFQEESQCETTGKAETKASHSHPHSHIPSQDPGPSKTVSSDEENPAETGEFEEARQLWNATAGRTGLPTIRKLGPERRKKLRRRLKECGGLKGWAEACSRVEESAFLRGENKDGWAASFDFLLSPTKLLRVLEGTYADKGGQNKQQRVEKQSIAAARNWASRPQQGAEA